MTKRDLVVKIARETGFIQNDVAEVVQKTLDYIAEDLIAGNTIELRNFGVFEIKVRKSRKGRNPNQPKNEVIIPERAVVKFRAGKELIQQLAHRLEHARAKHPWPAHAPGNHGALAALLGEMGEVVDEINKGDEARRKDELLDVLAVAWRWICDEQRERRKRR